MRLQATGQILQIVDKSIVVSGSVGVYTADFLLSDEWADFAITAVFKSKKNGTYSAVVNDNQCIIPWEAVQEPDFLQIGIYGIAEGKRYPTIWAPEIYINTGATDGEHSTPPTPDVYEQILNIMQETKAIAEDVEARADAGEFDGFSPIATVEQTPTGATITITDRQGTTTAEIKNGSGAGGYIYTQSSASAEWDIQHDLGAFPSVTVVDSANSVVVGDIQYINDNRLIVTFTAPFSGKAYLN